MAESKKPAARKTPARKTTQRKTAAKKEAPAPVEKTEEQELIEKTVVQQQGKVDMYNALKEQGLPIPADLREEVESAQTTSDPQADNPQRYIRNIHGSLVRLKLQRHTPSQRGIVLQPRGNRGDLAPVQPEDLNDPVFLDNQGVLFEILTATEAHEVVGKQTTNQQSVHPALAALRNERGEEYGENALNVDEIPFEQQGVTVAKLNDGQIAFDRGGIKRQAGEAPGTPGYVTGAEPNRAPANEDPSFLSDAKAREKANADLGLKVTVNPVQKT